MRVLDYLIGACLIAFLFVAFLWVAQYNPENNPTMHVVSGVSGEGITP